MILLILIAWTTVALALGYVFGKSVAIADEHAEQQWDADLAAAMQRHPSGQDWGHI